MRQELRGTVLFVAGLAILISAALHGIVNVPHLREDLVEIGVRHTLVSAIMLVLYFSVVAMFAFGSIVLSSAVSSCRGRRVQRVPLWIVAATYRCSAWWPSGSSVRVRTCWAIRSLVGWSRSEPH